AFSLQQVPVLVLRQDLQPRSHGETNNWSEGILESDAIDVVVSGAMDELTRLVVAGEEPIENGRIGLCARPDLPGCTGSSRFGRGFDVVANEPAAEPARFDVLNPAYSAPINEFEIGSRYSRLVRYRCSRHWPMLHTPGAGV